VSFSPLPSVPFFRSLTSGMSLQRLAARQMFRKPNVKKGSGKPPRLYRREPTAGPRIGHIDVGVFWFLKEKRGSF